MSSQPFCCVLFVQDYYTTMRAMPLPDNMQNIMLTSAMEMDGYTNLVFYRKRKTGDNDQDVEIMVFKLMTSYSLH